MALRATGLPFELAPSNAKPFTHVTADRRYMEHDCPIALLHYHDKLNVLGKLDALAGLGAEAESAIARANAQIGANFNNRLFWEFRYDHFPERGSGVGSRGDNLIYKRDLLRANGIEDAASVLDIGCGDLEVIKPLSLRGYTGVDMSPLAIQRGKEIFPTEYLSWVCSRKPQQQISCCASRFSSISTHLGLSESHFLRERTHEPHDAHLGVRRKQRRTSHNTHGVLSRSTR
ncbi:MAG: class I SAM-dependent methyltransferase [Caulobacteraceae bacterium]|nr:class I SAM-dependent methyltransferase [Caulobacteraceae bacterium]